MANSVDFFRYHKNIKILGSNLGTVTVIFLETASNYYVKAK